MHQLNVFLEVSLFSIVLQQSCCCWFIIHPTVCRVNCKRMAASLAVCHLLLCGIFFCTLFFFFLFLALVVTHYRECESLWLCCIYVYTLLFLQAMCCFFLCASQRREKYPKGDHRCFSFDFGLSIATNCGSCEGIKFYCILFV